jgi:DNA-directed RNA polymerase subunit M/transcription elongation factor TFIIS
MSLKFCKNCGCVFRVQKIDNNKSYLFCDKCQSFELVKTENSSGMVSNEKIEKQEERGAGISKDENEFANYNHICKKCGYNKAQIIDMGIFYSDEDNLILLKCGKCGFCERIGRKIS